MTQPNTTESDATPTDPEAFLKSRYFVIASFDRQIVEISNKIHRHPFAKQQVFRRQLNDLSRRRDEMCHMMVRLRNAIDKQNETSNQTTQDKDNRRANSSS